MILQRDDHAVWFWREGADYINTNEHRKTRANSTPQLPPFHWYSKYLVVSTSEKSISPCRIILTTMLLMIEQMAVIFSLQNAPYRPVLPSQPQHMTHAPSQYRITPHEKTKKTKQQTLSPAELAPTPTGDLQQHCQNCQHWLQWQHCQKLQFRRQLWRRPRTGSTTLRRRHAWCRGCTKAFRRARSGGAPSSSTAGRTVGQWATALTHEAEIPTSERRRWRPCRVWACFLSCCSFFSVKEQREKEGIEWVQYTHTLTCTTVFCMHIKPVCEFVGALTWRSTREGEVWFVAWRILWFDRTVRTACGPVGWN